MARSRASGKYLNSIVGKRKRQVLNLEKLRYRRGAADEAGCRPPEKEAGGLGQIGVTESQELLEGTERGAQVNREEIDDDEQEPE